MKPKTNRLLTGTMLAAFVLLCTLLVTAARRGGQPPRYHITVLDSATRMPVQGAVLRCYGCKAAFVLGKTDSSGRLSFIPGSIVRMQLNMPGYKRITFSISAFDSKTHKAVFTMLPIAPAIIDMEEDVKTPPVDMLKMEDKVYNYKEMPATTTTRVAAVGATEPVKHLKKEMLHMKFADGMKATSPGLAISGDDMVPAGGSMKAGMLTAGEVNDFAKWKLWNDLSAPTLESYVNVWKMKARNRYTVQVSNPDKRPVVNATVSLLGEKDQVLWQAMTDNTGKAELWPDMYRECGKQLSIKVRYGNEQKDVKNPVTFQNGINFVKLNTGCNAPEAVDIAWVVDATGSMGDEIMYLKTELNDVMAQAKTKYPALQFSLGAVFYRDFGDAYVTVHNQMSADISQTIDFINRQSAGGGGDFPEAVDTALGTALNKLNWNPQARTRLLFLVLDAPPHQTAKEIANMERLTRQAAKLGIRIIPLAASGIDKSTEYLMRCLALATNGTYSFLTDDSGIGDSHLKPTTDEYKVEYVNDLLVRLIGQFTQMPPCGQQLQALKDSTLKDTMTVLNKFLPKPPTDSSSRPNQQTITDSTQKEHVAFTQWKYYPNPTDGPLNVEIDGKMGELFLTDVGGKILQRYTPDGRRLLLDLGQYPSGIYYLRYYFEDKNLSGKVVLVRD